MRSPASSAPPSAPPCSWCCSWWASGICSDVLPDRCIRSGRCRRKPSVERLTPDLQSWVVEPLLEAGLDLEEIRSLVFRLAFESIVDAASGPAAILRNVVAGEPEAVQSAWA